MKLGWLLLMFALPLTGGTLATLEFVPHHVGTPSGFSHFVVNGVEMDLLCDDALRPLDFSWTALESSLTDNLFSTLLGRQGDMQTLEKYQWIAILSLQAYQDPSIASDIVDAIRYVTDPTRYLTGSTSVWLAWVEQQNPAKFKLDGFRVFTFGIAAALLLASVLLRRIRT